MASDTSRPDQQPATPAERPNPPVANSVDLVARTGDEPVTIYDRRAEPQAGPTDRAPAGSSENALAPDANLRQAEIALRRGELNEPQGNNSLGWNSDCGLASSSQVLHEAGVTKDGNPVTENDVVLMANQYNLADASHAQPSDNGGSSPDSRAELFEKYGVDAPPSRGMNIDDLAKVVEDGHGAVASVDAGVLWNRDEYLAADGQTNHAIWVTGTDRNLDTGQVNGFYVNDTGDGQSKFISSDLMQAAWEDPGGTANVTTARLDDLRKAHGQ